MVYIFAKSTVAVLALHLLWLLNIGSVLLKIAHYSLNFDACAGGNSENGAGNIFLVHCIECSLVVVRMNK